MDVLCRAQWECCPKDCMFPAHNKPKEEKKLEEKNPPPESFHWSISDAQFVHKNLIGSTVRASTRSRPRPLALPCCVWRRSAERPATVKRQWSISVSVTEKGLGG